MTRAYLWVTAGTALLGAVLLAPTAGFGSGGLWPAGLFATLALLAQALPALRWWPAGYGSVGVTVVLLLVLKTR
jgi:hypothetical protein